MAGGDASSGTADLSQLSTKAREHLGKVLEKDEAVLAFLQGKGGAIVRTSERFLVLRTGMFSSKAHAWRVDQVDDVYVEPGGRFARGKAALVGPGVENSAETVWMPGDKELDSETALANATNAIYLQDQLPANLNQVLTTMVPDGAKHDWDAMRQRRKELRHERRAEKAYASAAREREREDSKLGLSTEWAERYRGARGAGGEGKRSVLTDKELLETFRALSLGSPVIVRSYSSLPFRKGEAAFQADAMILARYGYVPTSQSFAANNVLTGVAIGTGDLIVSYAKRETAPESPPLTVEPVPASAGTCQAVLTWTGPNKILVIKAIRDITGMGLREAKDLVDRPPAVIRADLSQVEGDRIRLRVAEAGGVVELRT